MPPEILWHIFSYLKEQDVPSFALINKNWKEMSENNDLWAKFAVEARIIYPISGKECGKPDYRKMMQDYRTSPFIALDTINRYNCDPRGISYDGETIVGGICEKTTLDYSKSIPVQWKKSTRALTILKGDSGAFEYSAIGISGNGKTAVESMHNIIEYDCVTWNLETNEYKTVIGLQDKTFAIGQGISGDGKTIIGHVRDDKITKGAIRNCIWSKKDNSEFKLSLYALNTQDYWDYYAINFDGSVIVGNSNYTPCMWKKTNPGQYEQKELESLYYKKGGQCFGVSANGKTAVGSCYDMDGTTKDHAVKWNMETGKVEALGNLKNKLEGRACCVSEDGEIIGGGLGNESGPPDLAFRWTRKNGLQSIAELLGNKLPHGWSLNRVMAMTPDGITFLGDGTFEGLNRAWIATIPRE